MKVVHCTSKREHRRGPRTAGHGGLCLPVARPRRSASPALAVAFAALLLTPFTPAFGQGVCGTPPCGTGSGGKPIAISWVQDLEFGTLAGDGTFAGTATINPVSGTKTVSGGVYDFGGIHNPAAFTVKGDKNAAFTVTLPGSIVLSSGGGNMILNNFTSNPSGFGVFGNTGQATLTVGATLQVGAGQPAGTYTGVFTVTVDYQ